MIYYIPTNPWRIEEATMYYDVTLNERVTPDLGLNVLFLIFAFQPAGIVNVASHVHTRATVRHSAYA
jgi:hypothetical protein